MNECQPLKKALRARGADMKLPADFMTETMKKVHIAQRRRKISNLIWSIAGYAAAIALVITTLVFVCAPSLMSAFRSIVSELKAGRDALSFILPMMVSGAILLVFDSYLRRKHSKDS